MRFMRWLPTFLAFPAGGLLAMGVVGSLEGPVSAAAGGLLAGAVIGAAQWLALGTTKRWIAYTAGAMSAGTALAAVVTGAGTELADLMVTGLVAGAAVGAAQGTVLAAGAGRPAIADQARSRGLVAAWSVVTGASWSLAWLVTYAVVGVNADEGFFVFGSSGALVATLITGLALRLLQGSREAVAA
jgi:hypothetical protein